MTPTRPPRTQHRHAPPIRRTRHEYIEAPILAPHTPEAAAPRLELQHDAGRVGQLQFHTPQLVEDDSIHGHVDDEEEEMGGEGEEEDEEDEEGGIEEGSFVTSLLHV